MFGLVLHPRCLPLQIARADVKIVLPFGHILESKCTFLIRRRLKRLAHFLVGLLSADELQRLVPYSVPMNLSQIVCPIFVNGVCWGGLSISQTDHIRKWTASEIALVEMVAAQVEVAVSHSNLFQETKQAAEREALISHIIHGVNQSNRPHEIFPIVMRELAEHLASDRMVVTRFNEARGLWTTECEYPESKAPKPERTFRT